MSDPASYRYSDSHEWFHADGDVVTMGITKHAADELTDITYVEMKAPGTSVGAGESLGEVESVKTTSDVYTAVAGEIIDVNDAVTDDPALLNRDPLQAGWLCRVRTEDAGPLESLMDHATYTEKFPSE